jgi:hypothetical protein
MDNIWIVGACVGVLCLWLFLVWLFGQAVPGPYFRADDKITKRRNKDN